MSSAAMIQRPTNALLPRQAEPIRPNAQQNLINLIFRTRDLVNFLLEGLQRVTDNRSKQLEEKKTKYSDLTFQVSHSQRKGGNVQLLTAFASLGAAVVGIFHEKIPYMSSEDGQICKLFSEQMQNFFSPWKSRIDADLSKVSSLAQLELAIYNAQSSQAQLDGNNKDTINKLLQDMIALYQSASRQ